jgi:hypothetical protein
MRIVNPDFWRKENSCELNNSADLFPANVVGALEPPINSPTNSNFPAQIPENIEPTAISLEEIRHELQQISGTSVRDDADRRRRAALWRRIDQLGVLAWGRQ